MMKLTPLFLSHRTLRLAASLTAVLAISAIAALSADRAVPSYDAEGKLERPRGFRSWVAVGSSLGLGYNENAPTTGPGTFKTVYIEPFAYDAYQSTGEFPEGTMLVLAVHSTLDSSEEETLAKNGFFQGPLVVMEVAVKDSSHVDEGWAYYEFGGRNGLKEASQAFPQDRCFACHDQNAADDNVFVQFYPVLRDDAPGE